MHSYLKSIGFTKEKTKKEIKKLIKEVIEEADQSTIVSSVSGEEFVEYKKAYGEGFGIIVHGFMNDKDEFETEYYFPYIEGTHPQTNEEIVIEKHISNTSYAGACDDLRLGVSLIFYLQNSQEYIKIEFAGKKLKSAQSVTFSALSLQGTILFPINKTETEIKKSKVAIKNRNSLIEAARKGDEEAMETLTIEDLDTYTKISRRILKEDVFSIVDSSFMPYGIECDQYTVVGNIVDVKELKNNSTEESLYRLSVECNDFVFDVLINKENLLGEPEIGRRFKGNIWMQGKVCFDE